MAGVRSGARGLLAGAAAAVVLAACRLGGLGLPAWTVWAAPLAGLAAGVLVGLVWRRDWLEAAHAVDSHCQLKDRATTAWAFVQEPDPGVLRTLQVEDAAEHLDGVDPRRVVPYRMPRSALYGLAGAALAAVLLALPAFQRPVEARPIVPLPAAVAEAEEIEKTVLEELRKIAEETKREDLRELAEELEELVEDLKAPGLNERDALAKLSEMQAALAAAQAEYNTDAADAKLQELAQALAAAEAMKPAAAAIQEGDYSKAADKLEKLDPTQVSRKEAKAIAARLRKLAKDMEACGQGQLGQATAELCEGLESERSSQCKQGACRLAGLCRGHDLRKGIGRCLGCQLGRLAMCKGNCRSNCSGGNRLARTSQPSKNWGTAASGQPLGDQSTSLAGQRQRQDIAGVHGEGPSEKETSHSPEARQLAARGYAEKYQEYRKMSEAVLESEPLPLGHRETIRRYFESIHPDSADRE